METSIQFYSNAAAVIGGIAFLVAVIVQSIKEMPHLKRIPTNILTLAVSMGLCPGILIICCVWQNIEITWLYIAASIIGAFPVYVVASGGWEQLHRIWVRTHPTEKEAENYE